MREKKNDLRLSFRFDEEQNSNTIHNDHNKNNIQIPSSLTKKTSHFTLPMDHLESTTDDLRTPTSFLTTTIELTEISQRTSFDTPTSLRNNK